MRHGVSGRKLGRTASHRLALFKNMASSLIEHGRIQTTLSKAKELRKYADKLVTLGKQNTLNARRLAYADLGNNQRARQIVQKLFDEIAPAFKDRNGGYTRIYKIGTRRGDGSEIAYIEYLSEDLAKNQPATDGKKTAKAAGKAEAKKASAPKKAPAAKKTAVKKEAAPKKETAKKTKKAE